MAVKVGCGTGLQAEGTAYAKILRLEEVFSPSCSCFTVYQPAFSMLLLQQYVVYVVYVRGAEGGCTVMYSTDIY